MAKVKTKFVCSSCGTVYEKWQGRCANCESWNTIVESIGTPFSTSVKKQEAVPLSHFKDVRFERIDTDIKEFDTVLGGGIVRGSVILLSGDPGIGKSTLSLQVADRVAGKHKTLYASGEESVNQISVRGARVIKDSKLLAVGENCLEEIISIVEKEKPEVLVVDSIQTIYSNESVGTAGGLNQITFISQRLLPLAKYNNIAVIVVGHVTKEGNIAGPKSLEHLVDVVLYLEGNKYGNYRILKGVKNRFGSTNETGIFEMTEAGLMEVVNPSDLFISPDIFNEPGNTVFPLMEGVRPLLVEVQALTCLTAFGYPKRTAGGMDLNRLQILIVVLMKKASINLSNQDVYVKIAGGLSIREPGLDLAVLMALVSAFKNKKFEKKTVIFGEVGLAGEVRRVNNIGKRLKEAETLGFQKAVIPKCDSKEKHGIKLEIKEVGTIAEAIQASF